MIDQLIGSNIYLIQQEQNINFFQLLREYSIYVCIYGERENWMKMNIHHFKVGKVQLKKCETEFTALNAHIRKEEKSW